MNKKPILCLDFDGVIHSYTSGWRGAAEIPDPPVPGAMDFLIAAVTDFEVHIFSSRSHQEGGIKAMQDYVERHLFLCMLDTYDSEELAKERAKLKARKSIKWPTEKPPALVTIDDRAICFTGTFPSTEELKIFKPWNKK